jgi:hypothetical protein
MDVLIENSSAQLHGIPKAAGNNVVGALVQPTLVTLKPGLNVIEEGAWAEAKKHIMVQKQLEEGVFIELKSVDGLTKLNPNQAAKYIDMSVDSKMLAGWLKDEKRVKVKQMLESRLEALEKPEPNTAPPVAGTVKGGGRRE